MVVLRRLPINEMTLKRIAKCQRRAEKFIHQNRPTQAGGIERKVERGQCPMDIRTARGGDSRADRPDAPLDILIL